MSLFGFGVILCLPIIIKSHVFVTLFKSHYKLYISPFWLCASYKIVDVATDEHIS